MLGLGLSLPRPAAMDIRGWEPVRDLGGALIDILDPTRRDLITTPVGAGASSWRTSKGGYAFAQAVASARPTYDPKCLGGWRNLTTAHNALAGSTSAYNTLGNAVTTKVALADVPPAVRARFELDAADDPVLAQVTHLLRCETPGVAVGEGVSCAGSVLAGETCSFAVRAYAETGAWNFNTFNNEAGTSAVGQTFQRMSRPPFVPTSGGRTILLRTAVQGVSVLWFCLNEVYASANLPPNSIITQGAPAWGYGKPGLFCDGTDDCLTYEGVFIPTPAPTIELWGNIDQLAPPSDSAERIILAIGGSGTSSQVSIRRSVATFNRGRVTAGDGTSTLSKTHDQVDMTGRHVIRGLITPSSINVNVDGISMVSSTAVTTAIAPTRSRVGANANNTPGGFHQGVIGHLPIIDSTHPNWTPENAARLLAFLQAN